MDNDNNKKEETKYNIKELYQIYAKDTSIFSEESQLIRVVKDAIETLTQPEKIILLLYAEIGSLRKLAQKLDVSHSAVIKEMKKIKGKIYKYINDLQPNTDTDNNSVPLGPIGGNDNDKADDMEVATPKDQVPTLQS